jgi:WD40 repeat protein
VKPPVFDANNKLGCYLKKFISDEPGSEDDNRCLLILDQFEEVFQYHRGKNYFDLFITQLAEVINHKHCNVRVLFSMREEFLGELSVFDNRIPDLFSNYYRLKNPNKQGAKKIISRTCSLVDMPVDEKKLKLLVADLTTIETISATPTHDQNGDEGPQDSDIVAPPYLQIACRRLWERQFNSAKSIAQNGNTEAEKFLSDYKDDDARAMLRSFCEEILNAFNKRDRALLAEAFAYLVTKKGAKMAYPLSSLADHMGVKEASLEPILHSLSEMDSRILRESKGPDHALWYELYHDIYGKIIDEWQRAYRLQQKKEIKRRRIVAAGICVVIAVLVIWTWISLNYRNERVVILKNSDLSNQVSYLKSKQAFDELNNTWFWGTTGKRHWGDAWKRRASLAERTEDAQQAVLSWLKAAETYPPKGEDRPLLSQIDSYLSSDEYETLLASYWLEIGVTTSPAFKPILTADGKTLLTVGKDREVFFWDTDSYKKLKSTKLAVDAPSKVNSYTPGPPSVSQHAADPNLGFNDPYPGLASETQIQAATENLIGGIDNDKFCIWNAGTGQKLWQSDSPTGPKLQSRKPVPMSEAYDYNDLTFRQSVEEPSLSFSSNGHYFATSNGSDSFLLYKLSSDDKSEPILQDLMRSVTKMQFSPDGHNVALVFKDGTAQLRDLDTNVTRSLAIDGKSIRRIIFSSDGSRFLADLGLMRQAQIWNTALGAMIRPTTIPMGEQFFCPDNKTIASILPVDQQNTTIIGIRFWNSETDSVSIRATKFDERTQYLINPNGKSLLTIGVSGNARLWSLSPPTATANNLITESAPITANDISDDGQVIVTATNSDTLSVWNANDLKRQREFSLTDSSPHYPDQPRLSQESGSFVEELLVSPTGKYVCVKTSRGDFSLRKLEDNQEITHGRFENNPFGRPAAFGPNEDVFAIADQAGSITLWDQLDSSPNSTALRVHNVVDRFVFSSDGKYLAVIGGGFNASYVMVFDVTNGMEMPLPTEGFTSNIALGRNGIMIGTIKNDERAVLVWDFATRRSQKLRHDTNVGAVALNRDASYAITSTLNGILQLWETATGKPIKSGPCSTRVRNLTISEDGQTVVALSDKWVHIHFITKESLEYLDGREIASPASLRTLDPWGRNFRSLLPPVQDSLKVGLFSLSSTPTATGPVGDAAGLFSKWTRKLALDFDQNGLVTPQHPQ